ncbi:MAG: family 43 glycosylhydrolase [Agriterribacter sp.]
MNNYVRFLLLSVTFLFAVFTCKAGDFQTTNKKRLTDTIIHPVIPGDFADPSVIRVGNTYYATGTSSEWAPHYPLYTSNDLLEWKQSGYIFPETPSWALSSFWAPELYYRNGTYYVYYTARKKSDNISCIGVATSKDPNKGFTDQGIVVDFGKEAIDGFIMESHGKRYISFKAYGLDNRPIELLCYQLSEDGLKTVGEPFMLLRDDDRAGLEGQCIIRRNNYYYLFYSAGGCCGSKCSYHVNVARATSFKGPYTKYTGNPVLSGEADWKCTGHGTIVQTAKGEDYYLYHAYSKENDVYTGRQGMLAKLDWDKRTGWPNFKTLSGENITGFKDDFSAQTLQNNWQWDFRHAKPSIKIENGELYLSGETIADNISGTVLTVRPYKPNYTITTAVMNENASMKGLALYGDANQSVGIGVKSDSVQVWYIKDNVLNVLNTAKLDSKKPVRLKMIVKEGYKLQFYWSNVGGTWNELTTKDDFFSASFLPPWDRSPRHGLLQRGTDPAVFDFFEIGY